jgi:hypothetical protein
VAGSLQRLELDARFSRQLPRRVPRLAAQHQLHRHQRQPLLGHRPAQLVERHAGLVQLLEQREPCLALGVVREPIEQSFRREIGRAHR